MKMNLAFIGTGIMGGPMAGHLLKAGYPLTVWNRTPGRAEEFARELWVRVAATLCESALGAEAVFSCLPTSADVEALLAP